jgi:hypothetical protein
VTEPDKIYDGRKIGEVKGSADGERLKIGNEMVKGCGLCTRSEENVLGGEGFEQNYFIRHFLLF